MSLTSCHTFLLLITCWVILHALSNADFSPEYHVSKQFGTRSNQAWSRLKLHLVFQHKTYSSLVGKLKELIIKVLKSLCSGFNYYYNQRIHNVWFILRSSWNITTSSHLILCALSAWCQMWRCYFVTKCCKVLQYSWAHDLRDNRIQNFHLGSYIVGYTAGKLVLWWRASRAVKCDFLNIYTPNENFEYGYPILMHFCSLSSNLSIASRMKPHLIQRNVT